MLGHNGTFNSLMEDSEILSVSLVFVYNITIYLISSFSFTYAPQTIFLVKKYMCITLQIIIKFGSSLFLPYKFFFSRILII